MRRFCRLLACAACIFPGRLLAGGVPVPCSPDLFGPLGMDPVTIIGTWDLPDGCTLDFGDRAVVLQGTLRAVDLTIIAGSLAVDPSGRIEGGSGATAIDLNAGAHDGSLTVQGVLENRDVHGGGILVEADGSVSVHATGLLDVSATSPTGSGGYVEVTAQGGIDVLAGSSIKALAGDPGGFGGAVAAVSTTSSVNLSGEVLASGGLDGTGLVVATAGTDLLVEGPIGVGGRCNAGDCSPGGSVLLTAGGALVTAAAISVAGASGAVYGGDGNGGRVVLEAGGEISIRADIDLSGTELSRGGNFEAVCQAQFELQGGVTINAEGGNPSSSGGTIRIEAGEGVELTGLLRAGGGVDGDGGTVQVVGVGDITLGPQAFIGASGNYPTGGIEIVSTEESIQASGDPELEAGGIGLFGTGGSIGVVAGKGITLGGVDLDVTGSGENGLGGSVRIDSYQAVVAAAIGIHANGDSAAATLGEGGTIEVIGCQVDFDAEGQVRAQGQQGGTIVFTSGDTMVIGGLLRATADGLIQLRHPAAVPPDIFADSDPAPVLVASQVEVPCVGIDVGGTPFVRGNCNVSGPVDISDAIYTLGYLFQGTPGDVSCEQACDVNDDGEVDISDPVSLLGFLFLGGRAPRAPYPNCGGDTTDSDLTCEAFSLCP